MFDLAISPHKLIEVNKPDSARAETIAKSMRSHGWVGRPLLVEEVNNYGRREYYAWTGSHRIEAAKRAGLTEIPCRVITKEEADEAFQSAGYEQYGFSCWRQAVTAKHGMFDEKRLVGLECAGLVEAAEMLREEIRLQEASRHPDVRPSDRGSSNEDSV